MLGGLYPLGGPIGAGLAGGAEAIAHKIEGTPVDPRRMAVEAAIGAVPLAKYIQGGRALHSALRTGALTGVGEAGRQVARGEQLDPESVGLAGLLGGATGGLLGRMGAPPKPAAPSVQRYPQVSKYPLLPRTSRELERIAVSAEAEGRPDVAMDVMRRATEADIAEPSLMTRFLGLQRRQASEAEKLAKETEAAARAKKAAKEISAAKGALTGRPRVEVAETFKAPTPGGVEQLRRVFKPERRGPARREVAGPEVEGPQAAAYEEAIRRGLTPAAAATEITRLEAMVPHRAIRTPAADPGLEVGPRVVAAAPEVPVAPAVTAVAEEVPRATFLGWQQVPGKAPMPLYNVEGGRLHRSTVSPGTLEREGIPVPPPTQPPPVAAIAPEVPVAAPTPVAAPRVSPETQQIADDFLARAEASKQALAPAAEDPFAAMLRPQATETRLGRVGIFESPVDVAGVTYRAAKAKPGLDPTARGYLGTALQAEAERAGFPTRPGAQERLAKFLGKEVEPRLRSPGGPTAAPEAVAIPRAGAAAEVAPTAPTAAPRGIPDKPLLTTRDIQQATGVNEKTIDRWIKAGLIPGAVRVGRQWRFRREEVMEALESGALGRRTAERVGPPTAVPRPTPEGPTTPPSGPMAPRLVKKPKGEAGFAAPELLLAGAGAAAGAITDPFDNPVISALAGAGAGLAVPHVITGVRALGVPEEQVKNIQKDLQTPEGIVTAARKLFRTLPHFQRANYLWSAAGLPANALVGPWGSVAMGSLIKALSGDPRGWSVIRSGDLLPQNFGKDFLAGRDEALDLVRRAETAGTRFVEGESPIARDIPAGVLRSYAEFPAVTMTAGDVAARRIFTRHGFTEDEARLLTLTAEPQLPATAKLARLRKGTRSPLMEMMLPFVRTPANIAEGAALSTPGLGFITSQMFKTPPSLREQAMTQAVGAGAGLGGYVAGSQMDPETARLWRRYITNVAGRQAGLAGLGFAAGQASRHGQPIVSPSTLMELERTMPLPSAEPIADIVGAVAGQGRVPRGAVPEPIYRMLYPPQQRTRLRPIAYGSRTGPRRR